MPPLPTPGHRGPGHGLIGRLWRPIGRLARAAAGRLPALRAAWLLACLIGAAPAWAVHFDVELRTSNGPVAGSRITTEFYGDLGLAGLLPIDAVTGYKIFPGYFGDLEGGPLQTDDPGFQAFRGTFLRREEVHFRALGTLQHWDPATGRWGPAAPQVALALFGGIPVEVIIGYTENPAAWQTQYDYHAAGTRFSAAGVQGPLTAVIDDASSTGAFHAHLDWKISAGSGEPPVGAYLVTLELWSPTLVNGQPKYLASEPIHLVFERGISEAQMAQAITARVRPPAPSRCAAQTLAWQVDGSGCSADAGTTEHGQTVALADTSAPAIGNAAFRCDDGQWRSSGTSSCRPLHACSSQILAWQVGGTSCQAPLAAASAGSSVTATDSSGPATGAARFRCDDGSWQLAEVLACAQPAACSAETLQWQAAGQTCSASAPATPSGQGLQLIDSGLPTLGQASASCDNGRWSVLAGGICSLPPPRDCLGQAQSWTVGGTRCEGLLPAGAAGSSSVVVDGSGPALGRTRYQCTDGSWQLAETPSCAVPRACNAETLRWQVGSQTCEASAAASASGQRMLLSDSTAPTLGSASSQCDDGRWSLPEATSCSVPAAADCPAQLQAWQLGDATCQAALPAAADGSQATATDSSGPATGRARYRCQGGGWQLSELLACALPRACSASTLDWQVDGHRCSADAPASASGQRQLLSDSGLPTLGAAAFRCEDGRYTVEAGASCAPPPPAACSAQQLGWTVSGLACEASLPASPSGQTVLAQDAGLPTLGAARFQCSDGQWRAPSADASCAVPDCPATTLAWTGAAGQACQGSVARNVSGATALAQDLDGPSVGWARAQCQAGQWQAPFSAQCGAWQRGSTRVQPRAPWQAPARPPWAAP